MITQLDYLTSVFRAVVLITEDNTVRVGGGGTVGGGGGGNSVNYLF